MGTYLITGATSGIGQAVADRLADRGDRLILAGRSPQRLEAAVARLPGSAALIVDLERPAAIADSVGADIGPLDGLVHSAAIAILGTTEQTDAATWARTMAVNVQAPAELTRLLLPSLRAARGTVVFVNSTAGINANAGWAAYAASKFALRALADALRAEERPYGVRVTTVSPSRTATPMQREVRRQEGGDYTPEVYIDPDSVAAAVVTALTATPDAQISDITIQRAR
ncbi:SDR family oxidoreductase [Rhizohabitans arisaemae]|uniref:SDR family oxidoreductase n=1 Tax=Rhizohabitans arisaemae TaxID=2720610 RepID=UPI0024B219F2|nr:SDR family oxidoreductase [Rhizohabitans arisaemae]